MIHLLIVDDDTELLGVMARAFKRREKNWVIKTCNSAVGALEILRCFDFDAVLTDLIMPDMDGEELLKAVAKEQGSILRFLHSGTVDKARVIQALGIAHRFFEKPCIIDDVCSLIRRGYSAKMLIESESLKETLSQAQSIPAIPKSFFSLQQLIAQGDFYIPRLVHSIEREPSAVTALLKAANTAYFSIGAKIGSVEQALIRLGIRTVSSILFYSELFSQIPEGIVAKLDLEQSMTNAIRIGNLARQYAAECLEPNSVQDQAFLAGVLSDLGSLLMARIAPVELGRLIAEERAAGSRDLELERDFLGASRTEVAAYFLTLWGLPIEIVEAVAFHPEPQRAEQHARAPLSYLAAANLVLSGEGKLAGPLMNILRILG
jgi:HD-like signal output (HDOD) protein